MNATNRLSACVMYDAQISPLAPHLQTKESKHLFCLNKGKVRMTDHPSWRSPTVADDYAGHDFADFAQELLRRNSDYCREWAQTQTCAAESASQADQLREGLAGRWGLCFPLCAGRGAGRKSGIVVAGGYARRRDARKPGIVGVHTSNKH